MVYKIIIDPSASLEIVESIEWYNKAQPGLGIKFYKEVQEVFKTIQKNPLAFAILYKKNHGATVKRFPFMVHYFILSLFPFSIPVATLKSGTID